MDNFDKDLEDLLNMTDTDDEDSSLSSNGDVFEKSQPYVLELHELQKDEPGTEDVVPSEDVQKKKKEKSKKKKSQNDTNKEQSSDTSSSISDSIPNVPTDANKEEFYDAHESYHALPENQASPTAALVLAQVHSEHIEDPKITQPNTNSQPQSATPREPSTINKPVSNTSQ